MERVRNSIEIVKAAWAVLRRDKELTWLPVLSILATAVTVALFAGGFLALSSTDPVTGELQLDAAGYVMGFLLYLALAVITVFFNAAIVSAAHERMEGGDPTVESALAGATARMGRLLPWALVSATVSMVIRTIQERAGLAGRILGTVAGVAWSLVTFLVLPLLVIEDVGVVDAVRRSGELLKRTWGEQIMGNAAIGIVGVLAALAAAPVVVLGALSGVAAVLALTVVASAIWILGVVAVTTAMSGIFQTALYHFATTGEPPAGFTAGQMQAAFAPRPGRA